MHIATAIAPVEVRWRCCGPCDCAFLLSTERHLGSFREASAVQRPTEADAQPTVVAAPLQCKSVPETAAPAPRGPDRAQQELCGSAQTVGSQGSNMRRVLLAPWAADVMAVEPAMVTRAGRCWASLAPVGASPRTCTYWTASTPELPRQAEVSLLAQFSLQEALPHGNLEAVQGCSGHRGTKRGNVDARSWGRRSAGMLLALSAVHARVSTISIVQPAGFGGSLLKPLRPAMVFQYAGWRGGHSSAMSAATAQWL
jgi:hypothetical protein